MIPNFNVSLVIYKDIFLHCYQSFVFFLWTIYSHPLPIICIFEIFELFLAILINNLHIENINPLFIIFVAISVSVPGVFFFSTLWFKTKCIFFPVEFWLFLWNFFFCGIRWVSNFLFSLLSSCSTAFHWLTLAVLSISDAIFTAHFRLCLWVIYSICHWFFMDLL